VASNTYEPNRQITPCIISPLVVVTASDGSWRNGSNNDLLSDIKWYVNNKLISTLSDWDDLYDIIEDTTELRGSIRIKRNVKTSERLSLRFEANLADTRFGTLVPIVSNEIVLATSARTEDIYTLHINESSNITYNPLNDALDDYEYRVAHGLMDALSSTSDEYKAILAKTNNYKKDIAVQVFKGDTALSSDKYTLYAWARSSGETRPDLSWVGTGVPTIPAEVSTITDGISLDLRVIDNNQSYWIVAVMNDSSINTKYYPYVCVTIGREYPTVVAYPTNGTAILYGDTIRYDKAYGNAYGQAIDCPARIMDLVWKTDSAYATGVEHGGGDDVNINITAAKVGESSTDDWMDVYIESTTKGPFLIASDSSGNTLGDSSGNIFILNT
jgi:hypothetical protein